MAAKLDTNQTYTHTEKEIRGTLPSYAIREALFPLENQEKNGSALINVQTHHIEVTYHCGVQKHR